MAQFVKIYTKLLDDEWFLGLRGTQRAIFLQFIILAKRNSDTGILRTRSIQSLADQCAVSRRSLDAMLAKMQTDCKVTITRSLKGITTIALLNYSKYQAVRRFDSSLAKMQTKSEINDGKTDSNDTPKHQKQQQLTRNLNNIGAINRDQTRPDQTRKDTTVGRSASADCSKELRKAQREEAFPTMLVYFESFPFSKNLTERERYELAGELIKKCLGRAGPAVEFLHRRRGSLAKIQTTEGFHKYIHKPCGDPEFMGECESAANKQDDGTERGGMKSMKDILKDK